MKGQLRRTVVGLFLFGISFGYVEAAVVIYLRALYEPLRQRLDTRPRSWRPVSVWWIATGWWPKLRKRPGF